MNPRLRKYRGLWYCGIPGAESWWWSSATTPDEAYSLWERFRSTQPTAAAASAAKP